MKVGEIKRPPKLTVHTKIQLFFLLTFSLEFLSLWLIFRALKKLILTTFCQCSHCFYGGEIFSGPYSTIFAEVYGKFTFNMMIDSVGRHWQYWFCSYFVLSVFIL